MVFIYNKWGEDGQTDSKGGSLVNCNVSCFTRQDGQQLQRVGETGQPL